MPKHLISLSGNVGVGKSTIGPYLAKTLNAHWLSENSISSQFSHLFADESKQSRLISQITFSSLRVATILSTFLSGVDRIVTERTLWDSLIFHDLWDERFSFGEHDFFNNYYKLLSDHGVKYNQITIRLVCPVPILLSRISKRTESFDSNHSESILDDLDHKYETAFSENPPPNVLTFDVSSLKNDQNSLKTFAEVISNNMNIKINKKLGRLS